MSAPNHAYLADRQAGRRPLVQPVLQAGGVVPVAAFKGVGQGCRKQALVDLPMPVRQPVAAAAAARILLLRFHGSAPALPGQDDVVPRWGRQANGQPAKPIAGRGARPR
jgi:hypothetical protein